MSPSPNIRLPLHVERKLAEYCAKRGIKRSEAVIGALNRLLDLESGRANTYSLAADLIPEVGVSHVQSDNVRTLARKVFRGARAR